MAPPGKAEMMYSVGLRLLEVRKGAKRGEWLALIKEMGMSQPTAWRWMNLATFVKTSDNPAAKELRKRHQLVREIERFEDRFQKKHGHGSFEKRPRCAACREWRRKHP